MNINRHTYEEYFILYIDNELDAEERRAVEAFVQQHPDLKEELDTLLHYKMTPDTSIVFTGKEELLKENGHSIITAGNYEEWLSLYVDKELSAEQKLRVEKYIADNPAAEKDLAFFQQAKLQPEEIEFTGKASLYRTEEKTRRVFLWRAAAAILLIAFGLSAVLLLNNKPGKDKNDVATTPPAGQEEQPLKTNTPVPAEGNKEVIAREAQNTPGSIPVIAEKEHKINNPTVPENKINQQVLVSNKPAVEPHNKLPVKTPVVNKKEEEVLADNNKPSNNLPLPLNNPNAPGKTENATAAHNKDIKEIIKNANSPSTQDVTIKPSSSSDYIQAANKEELEQPDGKKNKNRGIFRKIARTFEKRTNIDPTDDNKLLVAGLSIKLK